MKTVFKNIHITLFVVFLFTLNGCVIKPSSEPGWPSKNMVKLGNGSASIYSKLDSEGKPVVIGIKFNQSMLEGLPTKINNTSRCFDRNGDGKFNMHNGHSECIGDHERLLLMPKDLTKRSDIPFQWVGINWNPEGHPNPAPPPWAVPHFDFHFYIMSYEGTRNIRPGTCGEMIDCEDFKKATKPVPARYIHPNHINVNAAVPQMGNHLIDVTTPELSKTSPTPFTHTFIYGAYDAQIIFYEPMITLEYFKSSPNMCKPLHLPKAWKISGYYPIEYCVRYLKNSGEYTVSLENFVYRDAE